MNMFKTDIDVVRRRHLAIAEAVDAWRLIPRTLVVLYAVMLYKVLKWYAALEPYFPKEVIPLLEKMTPEQIQAAMVQAPTTQHAVLVTATVGIAAAIFGLYSTSSKKWNGFTPWKNGKTTPPKKEEESAGE